MIEDASKAIENAQASLDRCLERLDRERILKITKTSVETLAETKATRETLHTVGHDVYAIRSGMGFMYRAILEAINDSQRGAMDQFKSTMEDMVGKFLREFCSANMQTGLYRLVEENEYRRSKSP